jgi:serine/threonine protein kinase
MLGAGRMATVYLAQDLKHDREVAIKVLRPELSQSITGERFLREIAITARLNHPRHTWDTVTSIDRLNAAKAPVEASS